MTDSSPMPPLTVDHVRDALAPYHIDVSELPDDAATAVSAAAALGITVPAIVKSLLFIADDQPVLVLVPGDRKVDRRRLAAVLGMPVVRLAKPQEVQSMTGYSIGGVPPLGHRYPLLVLMDRSILQQVTVYAAAGAHNAIFAVAPLRLHEITGALLSDITQEP